MSKEAKKIGKNVALALLSQVPFVSAFSKFCEDFVQDEWQERMDLWKEEVVKRLAQLDVEMEQKIRETSNFASILASAQRGALEDIEKDKVTLYANAVINAIKNENIDDTKKHIFLNILRDFTLWHIDVLKEIALSKGPKIFVRSNGIYSENHILSDLRTSFKDKELLEAVIKNLSENHLTYAVSDKFGSTEPTMITDLGKEFLAFIAEQEKVNG